MPPRTSPQSRLGLSRETIVEAADALLAEQGLPGLTMRAVAERLGTGTMTLYGYFRGKDELLDAVIDAKTDALEIPRSSGRWKPRLRRLMIALHGQLVEHPFLLELRLRRPLASPGAMRWTEVGLAALEEAGLSRAEAVLAFRSLFLYTFGHATFQPREPDQGVRAAHAALLALSPDTHPRVTAAAADLAGTLTGDEAYEYGLDRILDGIQARCEK